MIEAWKAVALIGERLDIVRAGQWLELLLQHPIWKARVDIPMGIVHGREEFLEAALPLGWVVRSDKSILVRLAHEAVDVFKNCSMSSDHSAAFNLLAGIAHWGGDDIKASIADALYVPGQPVSQVLVGAAHHFGKGDKFDPAKIEAIAKEVAKQIRLQVQRLQPGQEAVPPSNFIMESYSVEPDTRPKLFLANYTGLDALAPYRKNLKQESLAEVLRAALQLTTDRDNFLSNRQQLLQQIREFADQVEPALRLEIVDSLEPLARGRVAESEHHSKAADARNPFNPFKFNFGDPEDVQAAATMTFTAFASLDELLRKRIPDVLVPQFFDASARIRAKACKAAGLCAQVESEILAAVISALRDPNPDVVGSAFTAIESQPGWSLNPLQRRLLLLAIRFAANSPSAAARRRAAQILKAVAQPSRNFLRKDVHELLNLFRQDLAHSVRCVIDS